MVDKAQAWLVAALATTVIEQHALPDRTEGQDEPGRASADATDPPAEANEKALVGQSLDDSLRGATRGCLIAVIGDRKVRQLDLPRGH